MSLAKKMDKILIDFIDWHLGYYEGDPPKGKKEARSAIAKLLLEEVVPPIKEFTSTSPVFSDTPSGKFGHNLCREAIIAKIKELEQ